MELSLILSAFVFTGAAAAFVATSGAPLLEDDGPAALPPSRPPAGPRLRTASRPFELSDLRPARLVAPREARRELGGRDGFALAALRWARAEVEAAWR